MNSSKAYAAVDNDGQVVDIVCQDCAMEGDYPLQSNEVDSPSNCSQCRIILDAQYLPPAIDAIMEAIKGDVQSDDWDPLPGSMGYYAGSPKTEIVADWTRMALTQLDNGQHWERFVMESFLEYVPPADWYMEE